MSRVMNCFPGYEYIDGKNIYRETDIGLGGYIKSWPGIYGNAAVLDIESLHPNSIRAMNCFGDYTKKFTDLVDARVSIKHKDLDTARDILKATVDKAFLDTYLSDPSDAKQLAQALKIAINSVYGLSAAHFANPFRDIRNKNNIVALRGALFMRTLEDEVTSRGFKIIAIKTDSIKISDATKEIIDFCMDFAKSYGYKFAHEATYDRICQINDADYIAKVKDQDWCMDNYGYVPDDNQDHPCEWTATGKQFQVPYVFKKLFSHEDITFDDMCETFSVSKGVLYLDNNEGKAEDEHDYQFIGKVGQFCPIKTGCGGGILYRVNDDKYYAAARSSGYRWAESELIRTLEKQDDIDRGFYDTLVNDAVENISKYGDFEWFVSDDPYIKNEDEMNEVDELPWDDIPA